MRGALVVVLLAASCTPPSPDVDAGADDAGASDAGAAAADAGAIDDPYGFAMRAPSSRDLPCASCADGTFPAADVDHVCTLTVDGHAAVVYVAATATSIDDTFFPVPIYDDVRAFVLEDGGVVAVPGAYDYGGNHHNDFFSIEYAGARFTYDHSTYGFGFRACRPPDCLKIERGGDATDGCQPERTIAEICVEVADPLPPLVDTFATCPGDGG